jgi:hypothetical protein
MNNWNINESTEFKTEDEKQLYYKDENTKEIYNAIIHKNCNHTQIKEIEKCKRCSKIINGITYIKARKIYNKDKIIIERPLTNFKLLYNEKELKIYYSWDISNGKIFIDQNNNILFTYDDYKLYDSDENIKYIIIIHKECNHISIDQIKKCEKCSIQINKQTYAKGLIQKYNTLIDVNLNLCYSKKI